MLDEKRRARACDWLGWAFAAMTVVWLTSAFLHAMTDGATTLPTMSAVATAVGCLAMRAHAEVQRLQGRVARLEADRAARLWGPS